MTLVNVFEEASGGYGRTFCRMRSMTVDRYRRFSSASASMRLVSAIRSDFNSAISLRWIEQNALQSPVPNVDWLRVRLLLADTLTHRRNTFSHCAERAATSEPHNQRHDQLILIPHPLPGQAFAATPIRWRSARALATIQAAEVGLVGVRADRCRESSVSAAAHDR